MFKEVALTNQIVYIRPV